MLYILGNIVLFIFGLIFFVAFTLATIDSREEEGGAFTVVSVLSFLLSIILFLLTLNNITTRQSYFGYVGEVSALSRGNEYVVLGQYNTPKGRVVFLCDADTDDAPRFVRVNAMLPDGTRAVIPVERNNMTVLVPVN